MRRSNFALRLQPSLLEELRKAAKAEGVALNQLINVSRWRKKFLPCALKIISGKEAVAPIEARPCGFSNAREREIPR